MPTEPPEVVAPDRARFLVVAEAGKAGWVEGVRTSLRNAKPMTVKEVPSIDKAFEGIDEWLKAAGAVDEVIVCLGAGEAAANRDAEAVRRGIEKVVYRVVLYQPEGRAAAPRVTLVLPAGAANWAVVYREVTLGLDTRFVDATDGDAAERVAAAFAAGPAPEPPADVRVKGGRVTWGPSPTKGVIGYEVRDAEDEGTLLTTSVGTEATLPEGHDACLVRARDGAGRVSKAIKGEGG